MTTILDLIHAKEIKAKNVSSNDISRACDWLESYEFTGSLSPIELEFAQSLANVIEFLDKEITRRIKRR